MRFGKNVLSQNLRTECDLALYLTLHTDSELRKLGLPVPLDARPGIGTLRDVGFEQEALILQRLSQGLKERLIGEPPKAGSNRWQEQTLESRLVETISPPVALVQPRYAIEDARDVVLGRLGVAPHDTSVMPRFEALIPDLAIVEAPDAGMFELSATGERLPVGAFDSRLSISLVDIKHARQANPSYEAEVVLYGVMLANWLVEHGFADRYFVNAHLCLWTGGGVARAALQAALDRGEREPGRVLAAAREEFDPVNVAIYVQAIRRFFADRLPAVIRRGTKDWKRLDWYVGPACGSCDWLGYEGWLSPADRKKVAANPEHYCFFRAQKSDDLSRLPVTTRGSRRVMQSEGYQTVASIAATTGEEDVYNQHTLLRANRRGLPAIAKSIVEVQSTTNPDRTDGRLARFADLDLFISINFDPGAGLLTGIGLHAYFLQPTPYGELGADRHRKRWREKWIVSAKSSPAEQTAVLGFLQMIAEIFDFVADTHPQRGGTHAGKTRTQFVFWARRQFDELCLAIGRHLQAILYDAHQDRLIKALAWIFPPEELQERDEIDKRRPAVAFVRDVVRRLVHVPALHALTLFNVAKHYYNGAEAIREPDEFYREPLSDTIPRERIYEIWSLTAGGGVGTVLWGSRVVKTLNQLVESFARTIDQQGWALSSVSWRLRHDFGTRLAADAPKVRLTVPTWATGVAHDSKLWIAWGRFEDALDKAITHLTFLDDADELEASYEGLRLARRIAAREDGTWVFEVSPRSVSTKLRAPAEFLCIALGAIPGFPALTARGVVAPEQLPAHLPAWLGNTPMHKLFPIRLEALNRMSRTAIVRLGDFSGPNAADLSDLRRFVSDHLGASLFLDIILIPSLGPAVGLRRLERILRAVGNPPNARPAPAAHAALGTSGRRPRSGTDSVTPISRVLWDASSLHTAQARPPVVAEAIADRARTCAALNPSQTSAVLDAASRRLSVIWGPPGTGKTRTCRALIHSIVVEEAAVSRTSPYAVLVTGPTYKAVTETIGPLAEALSKDPDAPSKLYLIHSRYRNDRFPTPDRPGSHFVVTKTFADVDADGFRRLATDLTTGQHVVIVAAVVHQCPRITEALDRLDGDSFPLRSLFDFVVIDESSQVKMSTGVGPLALLKPNSQLVVVGDHLQMPPIFRTDPPLGAEHLVGSIQTYLIKRFGMPQTSLLENYRSNRDIVAYTRNLGYPADLRPANPDTRIRLLHATEGHAADVRLAGLPWSESWIPVLDPTKPIVAVTYPDGMAGQANAFEAECVAAIAYLLRISSSRALDGQTGQPDHALWDDDTFWTRGLGIVTPHKAQRAQVLQTLARTFPDSPPDLLEGAVDTVERFQGDERHTIIIAFGVGDPDVIRGEERFLLQLERTNVAISRAMGKCIVFLSEEVANHIPEDRRAAATAHALRGIADEWCTTRQAGSVVVEDRKRSITVRWRS